MNAIVTNQATAEALTRLRAQRNLYGRAKRLAATQAGLAVGAPLFSLISSQVAPDLRAIAAATALVVAILDVAVLDRWQKALRKRAAKIQEEFDCSVLDLPWNAFKAGSPEDPEDVHAASARHRGGKPDPSLERWYPVVVADAPLHIARLVCQRANLRWDGELRRGYARSLVSIMVVAVVVTVYACLALNYTMEQIVLKVLAPLAPFLLWGLRETYRQREAAASLDRLKAAIEALWARAIRRECDATACETESRRLQDEIFERRSASPLVFDWIYKLRRKTFEHQMDVGASELINAWKGQRPQ